MNVLIIGSKGFVGMNLVKYLRSNSDLEIYEADIVQEYGNTNYIQIDPNASDYEFETLFKKRQYAACINCSGAALVSASFDNPLSDYRLNTVNVYRMLHSIRLHNPDCQFITLSSAAVYGNPERLPVTEDHPLNPISPYGFHKMQSEEVCKYFCNFFNLNITVLRIFSAYGPGLKKQLFWDLSRKALNNQKISLFGTGLETRDFIYIEDLCQLIYKIILSPAQGYQVLNAASGVETSIKEAASTFYNLLDFTGTYNFDLANQEGYPTKWVADISSSYALNFKPEYTLEQGLTNYIEWLKELE